MGKLPTPPVPPDLVDLPKPRVTNAAEGLPRRHFTVAEVDADSMLEDAATTR